MTKKEKKQLLKAYKLLTKDESEGGEGSVSWPAAIPICRTISKGGVTKRQCEFCSELKVTESTQFNGDYCLDCYQLLISYSREAMREIKRQIKEEKENT